MLAPIIGVNADVAVGEVARPDGGAACADAKVNPDIDKAAFQMRGDGRFIITVNDKPVRGNER